MGKLAEAICAETRGNGARCSVAALLVKLPKDLRADLEAALSDGKPATAIARALTGIGYPVGPFPLQRHKRGDCGCAR